MQMRRYGLCRLLTAMALLLAAVGDVVVGTEPQTVASPDDPGAESPPTVPGDAAEKLRPPEPKVTNRIVATIDGEPVTLYELKEFAAGDLRLRQASVDNAMILETLITKRIIDKEIEAAGIVISDTDIDRYIDGVRARNRLSEEQLDAALAQEGVTMQSYRKQIMEELQKAQLINREIRGKVNVTPEDVERYYREHLEDYATPEQTTVSHIVLQLAADAAPEDVEAVMKRAANIHQQLEDGADFGELAQRVSEDAAAKSGGKLGTFKPGEMLDVLEAAVAELEPGEYSRPIRSEVGVHIVRLDQRTSASHEPLEGLAEGIKEHLYDAALEERYTRWLREDLRQRHHVEVRL